MKLRWFSYLNKYGVWSDEVLQYWDSESQMWTDVGIVTCREEEVDEYESDEFKY